MIRLVTCDIDGTLLHGEEWTIDAETLQEIERLRAKGILFCPASGRQYNSLRRLFGPMQNEIAYICENGAVVFGPGNPGPVWGKVPLDRAQALQLSREIMAMPECEVCISGENTSYLHTRDEAALRFMREGLGNRVAVIDDPAEIQEEIIKVSVFAQRGTAAVIDDLQERWGTIFQVAVSSGSTAHWPIREPGCSSSVRQWESSWRRLCPLVITIMMSRFSHWRGTPILWIMQCRNCAIGSPTTAAG